VRIPVYQPDLTGNEWNYVSSCLRSGWISSRGEFVDKFEENFARYLGGGYATSVCNGTVALHLAMYSLGIGPGDEVIVPTLTYVASVNTIRMTGATPVFVDAEPGTWNIDVSKISAAITTRTKAIMVVHLYGAVCAMNEISDISKGRGIYVIEDVAEAFGSSVNGRFAGTFGDIATFSFFGNKTITTGEGGMIYSSNAEIIHRCAHLKSQAVSKSREYWHEELGFNYRMTNVSAAIGVAQLERADAQIARKIQIAELYMRLLDRADIRFQSKNPDTRHTYWMVSALFENNDVRDRVRAILAANQIETRPLFPPVHTFPHYLQQSSFPIAENLAARGVNFPSFPALTNEQITSICQNVVAALEVP